MDRKPTLPTMEMIMEDPDAAGEMMRDFIFSDFATDFDQIVFGNHVMPAYWDGIRGDVPTSILDAMTDGTPSVDPETVGPVRAYRDHIAGIDVYWRHGDRCTLLIRRGDMALVNGDARSTTGWRVRHIGDAATGVGCLHWHAPTPDDRLDDLPRPAAHDGFADRATCWLQMVGRGLRDVRIGRLRA